MFKRWRNMNQTPTEEPGLELRGTAPTHRGAKMRKSFAIFLCIGIALIALAAITTDPLGAYLQAIAFITLAVSYILLLSLFVSFGKSVIAKLLIIIVTVLLTVIPAGTLASFIIVSRETASIEAGQLPRYPDSSNWGSYANVGSHPGAYGAEFTVNKPVEESTYTQVREFYAQQLAKGGWKYIGQSTSPNGFVWYGQTEPQYTANFSKQDLNLELIYPEYVQSKSGAIDTLQGFQIGIYSTKSDGIARKIADFFSIRIE